MLEKPLSVIVYLLFGILVIVMPLLFKASGRHLTALKYPLILALIVDALFVAKINAGGNHRLAMAWIIIAGLAALTVKKQWLLVAIGSTVGLALASLTPWWRYNGMFFVATRHDLTLYAFLALVSVGFLVREVALPPTQVLSNKWKIGAIAAFMPFALYLCFTTGMAQNWQTFGSWWHHWGAYIGPVEMMLSGGHILRDFPTQYGMGPTLLIAGACGNNCWVGMYYVVGIATALWALLILYIATELNVRSRLAWIVLPVLTLCACFFWTSYGSAFSSPILFPSVAGLRFTPVVALVAAMCWKDKANWLGHGLWALGALWSPETLYAVSFVWWPYYCWQRVGGLEWKAIPLALVQALCILFFTCIATFAAALAVYWMVYNELPSITAWLAYLLYPPAFVALNPKGPIWWYGAALLIGLATTARLYHTDGNTIAFRRNLLVLLLGYAALSYCMGRSLDNNFANLMPYALLILVGALGAPLPVMLRATAAALMASMLAWLPLFGWGIWQDAYKAGRLLEFAPQKVTDAFDYGDTASAEKLRQTFSAQKLTVGDPADVARAIAAIRGRSGEQVTVFDHAAVVVEGGPRNVWDGFHSQVIYAYLPQEWRTEFLIASEKRFHKSGWVIAEKSYDAAPWLESYKSAYDLAGEEDYGSYHAYHFVPKAETP